MERSPSWEVNRFAASQEIHHILWNPKVHYRVHKSTPHVQILRQIDQDHTRTSHFLKIHINIILSSTPGSSKWSPSLRFPHQNPIFTSTSPLLHTCYIPRASDSRFGHPNNIWWGAQIIKLLIMSFYPLYCYIVPLRLKYSPGNSTLKHSHSVWATKFHTHTKFFTMQKILCMHFPFYPIRATYPSVLVSSMQLLIIFNDEYKLWNSFSRFL
jgi:hypothetical protein